MTVRIVLADDHPIVREGLRAVLETLRISFVPYALH